MSIQSIQYVPKIVYNTYCACCVDVSCCCLACDQFYFQYSSIILTGLRASIGVRCSYSSQPFLRALEHTCIQVYWPFSWKWHCSPEKLHLVSIIIQVQAVKYIYFQHDTITKIKNLSSSTMNDCIYLGILLAKNYLHINNTMGDSISR